MRKMDIDYEQNTFQFSRNWFRNRNLQTFRECIAPEWAGKPVVYLELGVFEGQSIVWMLQKILTHPDSRAVGVDPWLQTTKLDEETMEAVMNRAEHNVEPWSDRCRLIRANSAEVLRKMCSRGGFGGIKKGTVDVCLVDGNHNALAVLDDLRHVHRLMRPGGWMLLDDVINVHEKKDHVRQGLDAWLKEIGGGVEQVFQHRFMEGFKKT